MTTNTMSKPGYGMVPPPWIDLTSIVPAESIEELHALADEYFDMAEKVGFKARELAAQLAVVEEIETSAANAALEVAGDVAREVDDGVRLLLSGLTGSRDIRSVMDTISTVLHPDSLMDEMERRVAAGLVAEGTAHDHPWKSATDDRH